MTDAVSARVEAVDGPETSSSDEQISSITRIIRELQRACSNPKSNLNDVRVEGVDEEFVKKHANLWIRILNVINEKEIEDWVREYVDVKWSNVENVEPMTNEAMLMECREWVGAKVFAKVRDDEDENFPNKLLAIEIEALLQSRFAILICQHLTYLMPFGRIWDMWFDKAIEEVVNGQELEEVSAKEEVSAEEELKRKVVEKLREMLKVGNLEDDMVRALERYLTSRQLRAELNKTRRRVLTLILAALGVAASSSLL